MSGDPQASNDLQPQTAVDSPIIVAGHSHMCALVGDLHPQEADLYAVSDFPNVFALHALWPRNDHYWKQLKAKSAGNRIALVWGGNEHNAFHFFQTQHPFDFVSRHVNKLISSFEVISQRRVRHLYNKSSFDHLRVVLADLVTGSARCVSVVGTPPPKKDSEQLRKILINEPLMVEWAQRFGENVDTVKITEPHVRLKLWFLIQEILADAAHQVGAKFIPVAPEVQDHDGFLRSEYWHHDVTHANRLYGQVMLRRVIEELS
jgi:hypothetical protein